MQIRNRNHNREWLLWEYENTFILHKTDTYAFIASLSSTSLHFIHNWNTFVISQKKTHKICNFFHLFPVFGVEVAWILFRRFLFTTLVLLFLTVSRQICNCHYRLFYGLAANNFFFVSSAFTIIFCLRWSQQSTHRAATVELFKWRREKKISVMSIMWQC